MTTSKDTKLLDFPCEFHYKIVGDNTPEFAAAVENVFSKHFKDSYKIDEKPSKNSKFISFNVAITATSRQQLDTVYSELHAIPGVHMLL